MHFILFVEYSACFYTNGSSCKHSFQLRIAFVLMLKQSRLFLDRKTNKPGFDTYVLKTEDRYMQQIKRVLHF